MKKTRSNSIPNSKTKEIVSQNQSVAYDSEDQKDVSGFEQKRVLVSALSLSKLESDDTTTASEANSNLMMKKKKCFSRKVAGAAKYDNNNGTDNPVETIRKQLEKLEDLGDQLPNNDTAYTVRYPFQDKCKYLPMVS